MKTRQSFKAALCGASLFLLGAMSAHASSYSSLYVFGDSLSDKGSIDVDHPGAPYVDGRFSNGPVAVEYLSTTLGITPSNFHDYAYGGATSGLYNSDITSGPGYTTGTLSQVNAYQSYVASTTGRADANGLYVVWTGANDFLSLSDPAQAPTVLAQAVSNIVTEVSILHQLGAQTILVPNLPDLGQTPYAHNQGSGLTATYLTTSFNQLLAASLPDYVTQFDTFSLFNQVIAAPATYGFSNVTEACIAVIACASGTKAEQNAYLFWDDVHPTTLGHQILAQNFATAVMASAVPETEMLWMLLAGLGLIGVAASKRRRLASITWPGNVSVQRPHLCS